MVKPPRIKNQGGLAILIDAIQIGLQQHTAPRFEQLTRMARGSLDLLPPVPVRIARAGTNCRLHDELRLGQPRPEFR